MKKINDEGIGYLVGTPLSGALFDLFDSIAGPLLAVLVVLVIDAALRMLMREPTHLHKEEQKDWKEVIYLIKDIELISLYFAGGVIGFVMSGIDPVLIVELTQR